MSFDVIYAVTIIEFMENYIQRIRPPQEIRKQLDINYRIENHSVFLFTISPAPFEKKIYKQYDYAKTTYDKKNDQWKIFWMKADLKWHSYDTAPTAKTLAAVIKIIEANVNGCFDA